MDRGAPNHFKLMTVPAVDVSFTVLEGLTAQYPGGANVPTATGLSVTLFHMEYKQEVLTVESDTTGIYTRFIGCVLINSNLTESDEGNQRQFTVRALLASGPSETGYLSDAS